MRVIILQAVGYLVWSRISLLISKTVTLGIGHSVSCFATLVAWDGIECVLTGVLRSYGTSSVVVFMSPTDAMYIDRWFFRCGLVTGWVS